MFAARNWNASASWRLCFRVCPGTFRLPISPCASRSLPLKRSIAGLAHRMRRIKDRAEILLDNVFRPLTVPATGGFFSAISFFVLVLQMIVPGTTCAPSRTTWLSI